MAKKEKVSAFKLYDEFLDGCPETFTSTGDTILMVLKWVLKTFELKRK